MTTILIFRMSTAKKNIKTGVLKSYNSYRLARRLIGFSTKYRIDKISKKIKIHSGTFETFEQLRSILKVKNKIHVINAWEQPCNQKLINEQKDEILEIFRPNHNTIQYVDKFFLKNKLSNKVTVGLHIRKKDYKSFHNGRYYFNDSIYFDAMNQLKNELQKTGVNKITFLLCSDSSIDLNSFKSLNTVTLQESSAINDLYALSKCDYIIGPPSTFSMWASFYGYVPLRFIQNRDEKISLSEFSPIIAQNRFKNGNIFSHDPQIVHQ